MSDRGEAALKVYRGLAEISAQPMVKAHTDFIEAYEGMEDAGQINLVGVDWFSQVGLAAAVPNAAWELFLGPGSEVSNTYYGYHPDVISNGIPLIGFHLDHEIVVPLSYTMAHLPPRAAASLAALRHLDNLFQELAGPSANRYPQFFWEGFRHGVQA